ncbi:unnamed protein product [Amoebophrya sp. A120]|nr:unnamed protein product [Amoebophrya sp. A120]|eukprot:GSA120T00024535001.1
MFDARSRFIFILHTLTFDLLLVVVQCLKILKIFAERLVCSRAACLCRAEKETERERSCSWRMNHIPRCRKWRKLLLLKIDIYNLPQHLLMYDLVGSKMLRMIYDLHLPTELLKLDMDFFKSENKVVCSSARVDFALFSRRLKLIWQGGHLLFSFSSASAIFLVIEVYFLLVSDGFLFSVYFFLK